jgi:hypothetical protein
MAFVSHEVCVIWLTQWWGWCMTRPVTNVILLTEM